MLSNIPGPFDIMYPNSESVDFTSTITTGYMSVIVPITTKNDIWSFVNPLEFEVWIFWMISIPIFIISMGVADYIATRYIDWDTLVGFVLRNVFTEHTTMPDKEYYRKIFIIVWTWSSFVLVMAFSGNLTAMITRPKVDMKINSFEDFLYQDEISLVMLDQDISIDELAQYPDNSPKRRALEQAQILPLNGYWPNDCFNNDTYYTKKHASFCDIRSIHYILDEDFSKTGKCNFYEMKHDGLESNLMGMAFQVYKSLWYFVY